MIKLDAIKKGERISMTDYFEVESVNSNGIVAKNSAGVSIVINGKDMIESKFKSDTQFADTKKVGKNELAEILQSAGDKIFTVTFTKQDGTTRELVGHFLSCEPNLGRTKVVDLSIPNGTHNIRQVDNRTIQSVIIDNVKYLSR